MDVSSIRRTEMAYNSWAAFSENETVAEYLNSCFSIQMILNQMITNPICTYHETNVKSF